MPEAAPVTIATWLFNNILSPFCAKLRVDILRHEATPAMDEDSQRRFMQLAVLEGRRALPDCIPNPPVGCVLVLRRVERVFIAILDPDPRNNGAGVEILKRAGIQVSVGLLEEFARQDLGPYLARKDNVLPNGS
jgi:pyrimidine deaminase RibD-like protein